MRFTSLVLALMLFSIVRAPAAKAPRPNIVLIMCDDMGWSDIGCYGGEVNTPNLDRMAKQGLRFTQFYNNAKCTTTRASIVTGLYPRRGQGGLLRKNMVTLGEAMKLAGYQTALSGKWHLGSGESTHPHKRGFDDYYGLLDGCCNFFNPKQPDPKFKGGKVRKFGQNNESIEQFPDDYYSTDAFTDHAVGFIKKASKTDKPFFLHVCYTAPHYPLHAKPEDIAKYRGKYKDIGWFKLREQRWARLKEMGIATDAWSLSERDSRSYEWDTANQDWEDLRMAVYAAMIDSMDQNIGRLMQTLRDVGADENTLVLFLSDNGGCAEEPGGRNTSLIPGPKEFYTAVGPAWGWAQNAPFKRYKQYAHEGGISTPCIARWPAAIKPDTLTREVGHIIDFMPTFLELAGSTYPKSHAGQNILPVEGKSLLPILKGGTREGHQQLAWEWSGNRALRRGDWKVVWDKSNKKWELYDLSTDRCETKNLAAKHPDRTDTMAAAWFTWAAETGLKTKSKPAPKKRKS
ncbi:MAG: arylsulfatase [Verrucomicrobiia bacterium]|jgi:arylsulfatase A-like enzyme